MAASSLIHIRRPFFVASRRRLVTLGSSIKRVTQKTIYALYSNTAKSLKAYPKATVLVVLIIACVLVALVQRRHHKPLVIVSAFEVPANTPLPYSGKTIANVFSDELQHVIEQSSTFSGNSFSSSRQYPTLPSTPRIPVETAFGLEIKGISIDQLISAWNRVAYDEQLISGDILRVSNTTEPDQLPTNTLPLSHYKCKEPDTAPQRTTDLILRVRVAAAGYAEYWQVPIASQSTADLQSAVNRIVRLMASDKYPEMLGRFYLAQNRFCEALDVFESWASRTPAVPEPIFYIGYTLARMAEYDLAKAALRDALILAPNHFLSLGTLGFIFFQQQDYEDSIKQSERAYELQPDAPNFAYNLGLAYAERREFDKAKKYYLEALRRDKKYAAAEYYLGRALETEQPTSAQAAQMNIEAAMEHYKRVLTINPRFFLALDALQHLLVNKQRYPEAEQICQQSAVLNPSAAQPLTCLGDVFYAKGQMDDAEQTYDKAIKIDDTNLRLWYILGQMSEKKEAYDKALLYYQRGDEKEHPKQGAFAIDKGVVETKIGDRLEKEGNPREAQNWYAKAVTEYCRAIKINPKSKAADFNLSLVLPKVKHGKSKEKAPCLRNHI